MMIRDLLSVIDNFNKFHLEARKIISTHESSVDRVIVIEQTYQKLSSLNLKQDDLIRQSLRCVEVGVYRAAHVLAWASMADYLQEWLIEDNRGSLNAIRPNWRTSSIEELIEDSNEFQIIGTLRKCGYISQDVEQSLQGLLKRRHLCAHPSSYLPDYNMALGYLAELLHWFEYIEKKR